jgi:MoCo/4Fe-4S cofactor protein with predicted Tat translocation signal
MTNPTLTLAAIQQTLRPGPTYWRSLEELAEQDGFVELLERELPPTMTAGLFRSSRRDFLKLAGAMLAMTGISGCTTRSPNERIVPYVQAPEELVQGRPLYFATAMPHRGYTTGLLVESQMGRPIKIEGNPDHPASLGATDAIAQGAIFSLYDPDRPQVITHRGQISTWGDFLASLTPALDEVRSSEGAGLYLLTETVTSPTLAAQLAALRTQFPQSSHHQYEPYPLDNVRAGAQLAFGRVLNPVYHFDQAQRILALDADFLGAMPGSVRNAREFSDQRRVWRTGSMSRLYAVECTRTITGAKADHRLAVRPSVLPAFARALAQALGLAVGDTGAPALSEREQRWLAALASDLQSQPGASLIVAGEGQPPVVHLLAHAMNESLGNIGRTVTFTEPVEVEPVIQLDSLRALTKAMAAGQVKVLMIIESNPVYTAPVELNFGELLAAVPLTVQTSVHYDETSARCQWHIPATHFLEAWSDGRAFDGTTTIIQPLIAPLFNSRSPHELLNALLGETVQTPYEIVRGVWDQQYANLSEPSQSNAESFWQTALHDGIVAGSAAPVVEVVLVAGWNTALEGAPASAENKGLELNFRPDPTIWDGRFANNAWLQELPKPLTNLTWDNPLLLGPATAARLGVASGDEVELALQGRNLTCAVWVMPGQPDETATLYLGYGRGEAGQVGAGRGFNAYSLRTAETFFSASGLEVRRTGGRYALASTQSHDSLEGRDHLRAGTLAQFEYDPTFAQGEAGHGEPAHAEDGATEEGARLPSFYPEFPYEGYAWGMAIDLTTCVGCNACVIACDAENNIPVVGKEQVLRGRELHWLKVDRYYQGEAEQPATYFQPRPCMHCEKAPCEPVCPVAATVHDHEGLNQMVYNRCVGTRYCSNNCPYKVRRYNFLDYNEEIPLLALARNPDVTVRERGVMEKCTYCVQRINQARIDAEKSDRTLQDGDVVTACQAACPTRAISFGNLNDPASQVAEMKAQPLNYAMLAELGTRPRTTYLAEVRNPNPELEHV